MPPEIKERLSLLAPIFEDEQVHLAYLFGSLSRGSSAEDVDLAIFPRRENLGLLREKIYGVLGTERLDLVNLKAASPLLRFEIISTGLLIYKESDGIENEFELAALREFRDTIYLRKRQSRTLEERTQRCSSSPKLFSSG